MLDVLRQLKIASAQAAPTAPRPLTEEEATRRYLALVEKLCRPDQALFRKKLMKAFSGRCAITGNNVAVTLDACHIQSVGAQGSDSADNGLLLRADLHRLFDAGLITISHAGKPHVLVARPLVGGAYGELHGVGLAVRRPLSRAQLEHLRLRNLRWTADGIPFEALRT